MATDGTARQRPMLSTGGATDPLRVSAHSVSPRSQLSSASPSPTDCESHATSAGGFTPSHGHVLLPTSSAAMHYDERRARELYKYYDPTHPPEPAVAGARPTAKSPPCHRSNAHPALTAYAQLAVIRLQAQRAVVSLVAEDDVYDVAEATQSCGLQHLHAGAETCRASCAGRPSIPKSCRVCEYTINLPAGPPESQCFIVDDLSCDARFADLPCVVNSPHARFYAGAPIQTRGGINIGSFFILDDKPRHGLTADEKQLLAAMAEMTMAYLDLQRDAAEGRKIVRMSDGLHQFIEGKITSLPAQPPQEAQHILPSLPVVPEVTEMTPQLASQPLAESPLELPADPLASQSSPASAHASVAQQSIPGSSTETEPQPTSRPPAGPPRPKPKSSRARWTLSRHALSQREKEAIHQVTTGSPEYVRKRLERLAQSEFWEHEWTIARGANLLRESLDLDAHGGVAIYDTHDVSVKIFERQFTERPLDDDEMSAEGYSDTASVDNPCESNAFDLSQPDVPVLATSCSAEPFGIVDEQPDNARFKPLPFAVIRKLLQRYPQGKVWGFDTGDVDHESRRQSQADQRILREFFPDARHLMFFPVWDAAASQWSSAAFVYNTVGTRTFSPETELTFAMSFGKTVRAEISRLEAARADRLKGDFIGSISHELRSPLHGVLASLDFLTETKFDSFQESLINTIETCGRTLLDTINHVLDYSKINTVERNWQQQKRSLHDRYLSDRGPGIAASMDSPLLNYSDVTNVASMLEEVLEGVVAGHSYRDISSTDITSSLRRSASRGRTASSSIPLPDENAIEMGGVEIILDIEPGDWTFVTQPGALRRCFMNIFGNATKFTDRGSILVRLETSSLPESHVNTPGRMMTFRVTDTGRGISADFLRSKIYTPFAQEDHLSPGTGLGMSIVKSITTMLGGNINVQSEVNQGTTVTISIPLREPSRTEACGQITKSLKDQVTLCAVELVRQKTGDRTFSIYGFDPEKSMLSPKSPIYYLASYIRDWYGKKLIPWDEETLDADIIIARNDRLPTLKKLFQRHPPRRRGLILVSTRTTYNATAITSPGTGLEIQYLAKPCGPYKLARALLSCLAHLDKAESVSGYATDRIEVTPAVVEPGEQRMVDMAGEDRRIPVLMEDQTIINSLPAAIPSGTSDYFEAKRRPSVTVSAFLPSDGASDTASMTEQSRSRSRSTSNTDDGATSPPADARREPRILLVEDNKINLRLLQTFIKKRKYQCIDSAEHGKLAIEAVEKADAPYDVIFMDISMPIMNGFEATQAIREHEARHGHDRRSASRATIIALTGLASTRDQKEAFAAGVDLYMTKPVSFREVGRLLDQWEAALSTAAAAVHELADRQDAAAAAVDVAA